MFSLFRRSKTIEARTAYDDVLSRARSVRLYEDFGVPDTPIGRFQMIALHAAPYMLRWTRSGDLELSQQLFDLIFNDIELSFREIGVGDLAVPKKMKKWMKDFNGIIQNHASDDADHVAITQRNLFDADVDMSSEFKKYIHEVFNEE